MIQEVVFQDGDKWYFWDETWSFTNGPFDTEEKAYNACMKYCNEVLGMNDLRKTHTIPQMKPETETMIICFIVIVLEIVFLSLAFIFAL